MTEAELYAQEEAEIAANDERLAAARRATRDATEARARAVIGSGQPFTVSGLPATVAPAEVQALAEATTEEGAALVARTVLHTAINAARAARKDPSQ
jgi:hypothetical protein